MRRRIGYALAGGLLAAGAPLGLLGLRLTRRRAGSLLHRIRDAVEADRAGITYVGTSTAFVFGLFGYVLGRQADRLADLSETDALTGLLNARGLFDRLQSEIARSRRYQTPLALLLIDVDNLKAINDRFGHRAGDQAIGQVADVIRSTLREADVGARWGGDEFAILAPNTAHASAIAMADRIRRVVSVTPAPWPLTLSVGVAAANRAANLDAATLMRRADAALYEAKAQGRNRVISEPASSSGPEGIGPGNHPDPGGTDARAAITTRPGSVVTSRCDR
jgi:diguanylate cyclase (GGDEF)-like protein